jgi:antitoxin component YwqK of YwqJK toxin-antitoxin module
MRSFTLSFIFSCLAFFSYGQQEVVPGKIDTIYFNRNWQQCALGDSALYYRLPLVKMADNRYVVKDYFLSNNQVQMKGAFTDSVSEIKSGSFIYYHENGNISSAGNYYEDKKTGAWKNYYQSGVLNNEGDFVDGHGDGIWRYYYDTTQTLMGTGSYTLSKKSGLWKFYYKSGNLSYEGTVVDGKPNGLWRYYFDTTQVLKSTGNFSMNKKVGSWQYYHRSGHLHSKGEYLEGDANGIWNYYYDSMQTLRSSKNYDHGVFHGTVTDYYAGGSIMRKDEYKKHGLWKSGKCFTPDGRDTSYFPDRTYPNVIGQNKAFLDYIRKNKTYNDYYYKKKIYGEVVLKLTINEQGEIAEIIILKGISDEVDYATMQIFYDGPKWLPTLNDHGIPIADTREITFYYKTKKAS